MLTRVAMLLFGLLLFACSPAPERREISFNDPAFGFLVDGRTSRKRVLQELGEPPLRYPKSRVWIYEVDGDAKVVGEEGNDKTQKIAHSERWQLVLAFDNRDRVAQHTLIRLR